MAHLSKTLKSFRQGTVGLTGKAESEPKELEVEISFAKDLIPVGRREGDQYFIHKFLPINPKVPTRMVTYCLPQESNSIVFLWNIKTQKPLVICPAYYQTETEGLRLFNAFVSGI